MSPDSQRRWSVYGKTGRHTPEARAVCGKAAGTDLGGGRAMKRTSLPLRGCLAAIAHGRFGTNSPVRALRRYGRSRGFNCRGVEAPGTAKDDPTQALESGASRLAKR